MTDTERWHAVLERDGRFDGAFVYAVRSTGVYCRPVCPSRRPGRAQVTFFDMPEAAEKAGYRACRRCRPQDAAAGDPRLETVRRACRYIDARSEGPPTLEVLGVHVGMSPYHLQRLFKQVMGVTPRQYADARRLGRVRALLKAGDDVAGALYEAGYGSSSRLYERAPAQLGMTPAAYKKGGAGARIRYALAECPLGRLLVAATDLGIAFVSLGDDDAGLEAGLAEEYPLAEIARDDAGLGAWLGAVLALLDGPQPSEALPLDVRATAFQRRVWEALSAIPAGETRSYGEIARALGLPGGARAVGRACATNPVSIVIPCHRAVRGDGAMGGYRWGVGRKRALIAREQARAGGGKKG